MGILGDIGEKLGFGGGHEEAARNAEAAEAAKYDATDRVPGDDEGLEEELAEKAPELIEETHETADSEILDRVPGDTEPGIRAEESAAAREAAVDALDGPTVEDEVQEAA
jgi:hypothetical protein